MPDGSTYVNAKGSAAPQRDRRVGAIDGVRALAIAVVIAYHTDLEDWPAWVADYKVRLQDGEHPTVRGTRFTPS